MSGTGRSSPLAIINDDDEDQQQTSMVIIDTPTAPAPGGFGQQSEKQRNPLHRAVVADPVVERSPPMAVSEQQQQQQQQSPSNSAAVSPKRSSPRSHPIGTSATLPVSSSNSPSRGTNDKNTTMSGKKSMGQGSRGPSAVPAKAGSSSAAPSPTSSLSPPSPSPVSRGAAVTASAAAGNPSGMGGAALADSATSSEMQSLLLEKMAELQHKEELIRALQRHVETLELGMNDRVEFCGRQQEELEEAQRTAQREQIARRAAESELKDLRDVKGELASVNEALVCFKVPRGGGSAPRGGKAGSPFPSSPSTASDVAALGRAFMALQLDVLRTFTWAAAALHDQYMHGAETISQEGEAVERRRIMCEMEVSAREIVLSREARDRDVLDRRSQAQQLIRSAAESLLFSHERLYSRLLLELSARHGAEWASLGALQMESMRKTAAVKLRQSNALLGKAREETEEKNKLLEESRRTMNLLKARFDATSKERAVAAAAAVKKQKREQQQQQDKAAAAEDEQSTSEQHLFLQRHEVPTAASASKAKVQQSFTVVDSPIPASATAATATGGGGGVGVASASKTPPPPLMPASRKITFDPPAAQHHHHHHHHHQQKQQQQQPQQVSTPPPALISVQPDPAVQARLVEARRQLENLQDKVLRMEDLLESKDEMILRIKTERNVLELECDAVTAQCRLLDQACRLGARLGVEEKLLRMQQSVGM